MDFSGGSDGKEFACNARNPGLTPGSGRFLGKGMATHSNYSCLENSVYRRTWWAIVHGVKKSQA